MRIQQIWATLIGLASLTIGIIRFFIPRLNLAIPLLDGLIHIVTGLAFLIGAWFRKGKFVNKNNLWLGIFYILFGVIGLNWPHIIVGIISVLISFLFKKKPKIL